MKRLLEPLKLNSILASSSKLATFSKSNRGSFFQKEPKLDNQYSEDPFLKEQLAIEIPIDLMPEIETDLFEFGEKVAKSIHDLHLECERFPPKLEQFDAWGNRVDKLITCNAWKEMKKISAKEGLVAIPYEKKYSGYSRLYQMMKLYLYAPSSGMYTCPLAMTDGAANTLQSVGLDEVTSEPFSRLTSRDPDRFWTSGQWMTERRGGSDVAFGTESVAIPQLTSDKFFNLHGYKWFSSATDADMTITLARIYGEDLKPSHKLTMFFAKVRNDDNELNGIEIQRLKNKLGTNQLPTAEILLDGMIAYRLSDVDNGIAKIGPMLNVTRVHNSMWAVANMRRTINLARDYATKRIAFGKLLIEHDLHNLTLGNMEIECRASFLSLVFVAKLLGKFECNLATQEDKELLRFVIPLLKLYTAKQSIAVASEGLEAFGGQGYIEDTGLPNLLRDAQVLSIWEGTTNVLSMDVLKSIKKSNGESLNIFHKHIMMQCEKAQKFDLLKDYADRIQKLATKVCELTKIEEENEISFLANGARDFSYSLYRILTASLILRRCVKSNLKESDLHLLKRWCMQDLAPILTLNQQKVYDLDQIRLIKDLLYDGYHLKTF